MKRGGMDDGEKTDNGCDGGARRKREKRKQTGGERSVAAHTHTHKYFSLFRGFNEAVRMKNDPVKSNNSTSTPANFPRRIAEETRTTSWRRRRGRRIIGEALWPGSDAAQHNHSIPPSLVAPQAEEDGASANVPATGWFLIYATCIKKKREKRIV